MIFIETSTLFHIFRRQVALQMCNSYVTEKTCTSGNVWALLPPSLNFVARLQFKVCKKATCSNQAFFFSYVTRSAAEKLRVQLYKTVKISRNSYRLWKKIDTAINLPNKQRLVDSEFTRQQYTVHKIFLCSDFENFRQISTNCRFWLLFSIFWPPIIKNVEKLQRLFLVVWQTIRRSMQIYWKIGRLLIRFTDS